MKCHPRPASGLALVASVAAAMLCGASPCFGQTESDALQRSVELVGGAVSSLADQLDSFLGNERVEAEANRTRLRLGGGAGWFREDGTKLEGNVDFRLSLPRTGNRLSLFVNGAGDERPTATAPTAAAVRSLEEERRFESAGLGARYFFVRNLGESLRIDAGGQKGINLDPFVRPRYRLTFDAAPWTLSPIEEATWSLADGFSADGLVEADWKIDDRRLFRVTPSVRWDEQHRGFGYGLSARELALLSPSSVVEGIVAADFRTQPNNRLVAAVLRVRYRRTIGWDWLELEVAPELGFQRFHDYAANPGVFVRLQITFGPTDLRSSFPRARPSPERSE